jgi:hypothetical protein
MTMGEKAVKGLLRGNEKNWQTSEGAMMLRFFQ